MKDLLQYLQTAYQNQQESLGAVAGAAAGAAAGPAQ